MRSTSFAFVALLAASFIMTVAPGCGSDGDSSEFNRGDDGDSGLLFGDGAFGDDGPCIGLSCQVASCPGGGTTTVSGVVYAPTKVNPDPLYNAIVYIPN